MKNMFVKNWWPQCTMCLKERELGHDATCNFIFIFYLKRLNPSWYIWNTNQHASTTLDEVVSYCNSIESHRSWLMALAISYCNCTESHRSWLMALAINTCCINRLIQTDTFYFLEKLHVRWTYSREAWQWLVCLTRCNHSIQHCFLLPLGSSSHSPPTACVQ